MLCLLRRLRKSSQIKRAEDYPPKKTPEEELADQRAEDYGVLTAFKFKDNQKVRISSKHFIVKLAKNDYKDQVDEFKKKIKNQFPTAEVLLTKTGDLLVKDNKKFNLRVGADVIQKRLGLSLPPLIYDVVPNSFKFIIRKIFKDNVNYGHHLFFTTFDNKVLQKILAKEREIANNQLKANLLQKEAEVYLAGFYNKESSKCNLTDVARQAKDLKQKEIKARQALPSPQALTLTFTQWIKDEETGKMIKNPALEEIIVDLKADGKQNAKWILQQKTKLW